jgi:hypothetical protein
MMKPSELNHTIACGTVTSRLAWIVRMILPVFAAGVLFAACAGRDDEETIRSLIDRGAALAETHDVAGLLSLASADIRAMPMNLNQSGIKGVLWRTFKYYGPMTILYPRPTVEIDAAGHDATARFPFLIVKKEHPFKDLERFRDDPVAWIDAIGETADLYRLRLQLTRQDGNWLVEQAFLERFSGLGFDT